MDEIRRQVGKVRRRLVIQQFSRVLPWSLFATLLAAAVALAVPKIYPLGVDQAVWIGSWVGGSLVLGLLIAIVWTWYTRCNALDAAVEIDRRFGLKERVSSALALAPDELDSSAGKALVADASRRVEVISVRDKFTIRSGWTALLPFAPALLAFVLAMFVADAQPGSNSQAAASIAEREDIKKSAEALQKRLARQRELAEQKGLKDADQLFDRLNEGVDELTNQKDVDRKQALVKINDLAQEVERRRNALGDPNEMKKQFDKLKNIERGPAEKIASALEEGDFDKAIEQLKALQEKLTNDNLTDEEKAQLGEQLKQMNSSLQEMADAHKQAKQDLERQIQQKMAEGDLEAANELQRKLDQLSQRDQQMERLEKMAQQLGECQACMQNGDSEKAAAQLAELAAELQEMQAEMAELESLDEIMAEIANAKDAMRGDMGNMDMMAGFDGMSDRFSDRPGDGLGEGRGYGYRPEEETATGEYDSRQRGDIQPGQAVRVGDAFGPNKAGRSQEAVKEEIMSALREDADPLTDQRLPRSQREHVNEYFRSIRKGE